MDTSSDSRIERVFAKVRQRMMRERRRAVIHRGQNWVGGVRRGAQLHVQSEFHEAVTRMAKTMGVPIGVVVERALIAFFEGQNGTGGVALATIADARKYAEQGRGYTPRHGGDAWRELVSQWGPARFIPRSGFRWRSGSCAEREASQGIAHHCLWCDAHTVSGGELIEHRADCPTTGSSDA